MNSEFIRRIKVNFRYDAILFSSPNFNFLQKILFLVSKYSSILGNRRKIRYLGSYFFYDSRLWPATLVGYPGEIWGLHRLVNFSKIRTVLDIGANIGRFAYTLKKFFPHLSIYSFEPNKEIFPVLKKNLSHFRNLKVYNFALGQKRGYRRFYFSPNASSEGSFYRENAIQTYNRRDIKKSTVEVIKLTWDTLDKLGIPSKFDLVKIDVEGAELEVLESIKNLNFKYLIVEVSVTRGGAGNLKNITNLIKKQWGVKPKLLSYNLFDKNSPAADAIFILE